MRTNSQPALGAFLGAVLIGSQILAAEAAELRFEHVMNIGTQGYGEGQFNYVEDFDMAIGDQHIIVTDASHAWVQVFDKTNGKFITRFAGKGDEKHQMEKPEGISVDPQGNIFVADYRTGEVKVYDRNYKWLRTFSEYGSEPGQNIKSEFSSIYDGRYYMAEAGNHRVSVWDLRGKFLFTFGKKGALPGQLNNPEAAKVNSEGKVYVSDLKNDRIQVFDLDGKFLFSWGSTGSGPGQFMVPAGISFDKEDNVYVTEIGNNRVQVFDKNGIFITKFGRKGSGDGEFGNLHGIYCDKVTGWLYIADTANNRVQVFRPAGSPSNLAN
jgi:DNA-binding beta-propeller fold protein YncE